VSVHRLIQPALCPLDAERNEVCPPTDEPSPVPEPPLPECPDAGPEVCGEEPPPEGVPPDSDMIPMVMGTVMGTEKTNQTEMEKVM
jgi:hypothetical protein